MNPMALGALRCPDCGSRLLAASDELCCQGCGRRIPLVNGVVRFVRDRDLEDDAAARRTRASFGYEWTHFDDWRPSGTVNFNDYFAHFDLATLQGGLVLDAGCGMGRHTRQVAQFAAGVVALDFSRAIDAAARNTADQPNVQCVQGDLRRLPLAADSFDFVYSMGVLHHIDDTAGTLRGLVRVLKPGGRLRVYLYWKREGLAAAVLSLVTLARRLTVRLPFPVLRAGCWALSVLLTVGVIGPYRLLERFGVDVKESWPLSVYVKYPFNVLYNDQFDRFSAPIEKRYSPDEVRTLLAAMGLRDVEVHPRFGWIADGVKPSA
jgi:SAM-dependent methyltransferase